MKESRFRGWKDVFFFTFRQMTKKTGYRAVTAVVALMLVAALVLVIVVTGKPDEKKVERSDIRTVYVIDNPYQVDYAQMFSLFGRESFLGIHFLSVPDYETALEYTRKDGGEVACVIVAISYKDNTFYMEGILPENSSATKSETEDLLAAMSECFEYAKTSMVQLTAEQGMAVMMPVVTGDGKIGEDHSVGAMIIKMMAPMVFGLVLYMMLIFYGQDVSREISMEKVSKLTETLLTSVKPYAMITGKVLAVSLAGIIQFFIWIVCSLVGLFIGDAIAKSMYPGYQNVILQVLDYVRETFSTSAFSPVAILLAALIFIVGFLFYSVLAGMAGSLVSKPEDTAQVQNIFQFPIIISFFACYFGVLMEKEGLVLATRFIPFTIPFGMPCDLLTGTASILQGVVSLVILLAFAVLCIILSGRLYEGLILYNGQKMNLKKLVNVIRVKK
ncbi:MAG: ABC transporter permease [Lachnospiraceae bacterium]|nr:ABC transporter permease [Lachnospiraceae bacterium]